MEHINMQMADNIQESDLIIESMEEVNIYGQMKGNMWVNL